MSDKKEEPAKDGDKKPSARSAGVIAAVVTGVIAGGAAFGGARLAGRGGGAHHAPAAEHAPQLGPPGYTLSLEPFLVMASDANRRAHPMRVVLAVEFERTVTEEAARVFVARIRDSVIAYLRTVTYETAAAPERMDSLRHDLLDRVRATGATGVTRVLVTDLVVQ